MVNLPQPKSDKTNTAKNRVLEAIVFVRFHVEDATLSNA